MVAEGAAFHPQNLSASAGELTLTLDNRDADVQHDLYVYGLSGGELGSTPVTTGPAVTSVRVDVTAGTYRFVCTVHPLTMTGWLTVQ